MNKLINPNENALGNELEVIDDNDAMWKEKDGSISLFHALKKNYHLLRDRIRGTLYIELNSNESPIDVGMYDPKIKGRSTFWNLQKLNLLKAC